MPRPGAWGGDATDGSVGSVGGTTVTPTSQRIAVFGMGYVGCTAAASLASRGNTVIGVDVSGRSPVVEVRVNGIIADQVGGGPADLCDRLGTASVCLGTPSTQSGSLLTSSLEPVSEAIGAATAGRECNQGYIGVGW